MALLEAMLESHDLKNWEYREPIPGMRHNKTPKWVAHRFPIKGGRSSSEVIAHNVSQNNALLLMMIKRGRVKTFG